MFESILSAGLGNLSDTIQSDQRTLTPDFDVMSSAAQDLVLEIADCEVFIRAHDTAGKRSLSKEDLVTFLAPDGG